jgi:hypothetical protein
MPAVLVSATFDWDAMGGALLIDGPSLSRRFQIKALPHAATYSLLFEGYGSGDRAPTGEKLGRGKSVIARLVADGDDMLLYFDSDYQPPVAIPARDHFTCDR